MSTDVQQFMTELGAGVVEKQLSAMISDVAGAVVDHQKQGKVLIEMTIKKIGNPNGNQVNFSTKVAFTRPTARGKKSEEDTIDSTFYVGTHNAVTQFPENQLDAFRDQAKQPQHS